MRLRTLGLALLIAAPLAAAPSPRAFTLDDLTRMKRVSDPQISPDGGWVAYTVRTVDAKEDKATPTSG